MKKNLSFWALVFVVGGLAGIFGSHIFLPWAAGLSVFKNIDWVRQIKQGTTVINRAEKIYITDEMASQDAVGKLINSSVEIISFREYKKVGNKEMLLPIPEKIARGSGLILTGDGMIATSLSLIPIEASKIIVKNDSESLEAEILKKDEISNLVLLKIAKTNLPVAAIGDYKDLRLGEKTILVGREGDSGSSFTDNGFVRKKNPLAIQFSDAKSILGAPLANIRGEVIGLVSKTGAEIQVATNEKIRELMK